MLILWKVNCPDELKERFYVRNIYAEIGPVIENYERQVEAFVVLTCNTSVLKPFSLVVSGKCMLFSSVSLQQRFGVTDSKALSMSQLSGLGQTVL